MTNKTKIFQAILMVFIVITVWIVFIFIMNQENYDNKDQKEQPISEINLMIKQIDDCWKPVMDYNQEDNSICDTKNMTDCYKKELAIYKLREERDLCLIRHGVN